MLSTDYKLADLAQPNNEKLDLLGISLIKPGQCTAKAPGSFHHKACVMVTLLDPDLAKSDAVVVNATCIQNIWICITIVISRTLHSRRACSALLLSITLCAAGTGISLLSSVLDVSGKPARLHIQS